MKFMQSGRKNLNPDLSRFRRHFLVKLIILHFGRGRLSARNIFNRLFTDFRLCDTFTQIFLSPAHVMIDSTRESKRLY